MRVRQIAVPVQLIFQCETYQLSRSPMLTYDFRNLEFSGPAIVRKGSEQISRSKQIEFIPY